MPAARETCRSRSAAVSALKPAQSGGCSRSGAIAICAGQQTLSENNACTFITRRAVSCASNMRPVLIKALI